MGGASDDREHEVGSELADDLGEAATLLASEESVGMAELFAPEVDVIGYLAEQNRVFDNSSGRGIRVVLATNVAETSLTVPGIRYVIDPGLARIRRPQRHPDRRTAWHYRAHGTARMAAGEVAAGIGAGRGLSAALARVKARLAMPDSESSPEGATAARHR